MTRKAAREELAVFSHNPVVPPSEIKRRGPLPDLLSKLLMELLAGAPPVREVAAVRPAFLDPDVVGAFADPALVRLARDRGRAVVGCGRRGIPARLAFAACFLDHEKPLAAFSFAGAGSSR